MRTLSLLFLLGSSSAAAADDCSSPTRASDVNLAIERAVAAYGNLEVDQFNESLAELDASLPCLGELLPRSQVASVHRMLGVRSYLDDSKEAPERKKLAEAAFAAAKSIEPAYRFPDSLFPEQHPVRRTYDAAPEAAQTETLPPAKTASIRIDGRLSAELPTSRSALVQIVDDQGLVTESGYLWPGDNMLSYEIGKPAVYSNTTENTATIKSGPNKPLLFGALGAAVAAGVVYGVAGASHAKWDSEETPLADKDGLRSRTNTMVLASSGLGVVAAGLGTSAFLVARW